MLNQPQNNSGQNGQASGVHIKSRLVSRNVTISGHRTSIRLEPDMWAALMDICKRERTTIHGVCSAVAQSRHEDSSLTAAIRVFIMAYYRAAATDEGHNRAGHGNAVPFEITSRMLGMGNSPATNGAATSTANGMSSAWVRR